MSETPFSPDKVPGRWETVREGYKKRNENLLALASEAKKGEQPKDVIDRKVEFATKAIEALAGNPDDLNNYYPDARVTRELRKVLSDPNVASSLPKLSEEKTEE